MGKKFGAPAADGAYAQWPIFKSVNKLDNSTMKFENVGFPVREPMLASGEVDAVFGFSFSVYMNLKSRGVPVDDIVMMLMSDHGVELYGNVLMVSPKFAAEKPEAIKGFIRALTKGLRDTVADTTAATATVIKRNDVAKADVEKERLELSLKQNFVTPWVAANGYGGIDKARFAKSIDQIGLTFNFKKKPKRGGCVHRGLPAATRRPQGELVVPGLVPGIQPSTSAGASRRMDPGDKRRDDKVTDFVSIDNVTHAYGGDGGVIAVDKLTLAIAEGEFAAVVGPSGCGKSTLMKLVTGLQFPRAGKVMVGGERVTGPLKIAGMAFQAPNLLPWRRTLENILLPLEIVQPHRRRLRSQRAAYIAKVEALLAQVGLGGTGSQVSLGAIGRHAAARLALSRADP